MTKICNIHPTASHFSSMNRVVLGGVLVEPPVIRVTPAGKPVASLEVEHHSADSQSQRQIACRVAVIALDQLAEFCRSLKMDTPLLVIGELDQRRWIRDGQTRWGRCELVASEIQVISDQEKTEQVGSPL